VPKGAPFSHGHLEGEAGERITSIRMDSISLCDKQNCIAGLPLCMREQ
jgi:hypothetical protein